MMLQFAAKDDNTVFINPNLVNAVVSQEDGSCLIYMSGDSDPFKLRHAAVDAQLRIWNAMSK